MASAMARWPLVMRALVERPLERIGIAGRPGARCPGAGRVGPVASRRPAEFVEQLGTVFDVGSLTVRAVARALQDRRGCVASTDVSELS